MKLNNLHKPSSKHEILINSTAMKYFIVIILLSFLKEGVFGADEIKKERTEGDSLTLPTGRTEVQSNDVIYWLYGSDIIIAVISGGNFQTHDGRADGIFKGKLELEKQTGSLTIKDIRIKNSGDYQLDINKKSTFKKFSVTVYAPLPIPAIDSPQCASTQAGSSSSKCVLLCSVVNVSHVTLSWYKGNSLLSSISVSDLSISLSLPLEVEYQDKNNYSCVINNPISNQTQHLDIKEMCQICPVSGVSPGVVAGIVFAVLLVPAAAAVIYYRHRMSELKKQTTETVKSMEGDFAFLSSPVTEIQEGDQMLWAREDVKSPIATMSKKDKKTYFYDDKQFRGRLQLDPQNGSLIIRNLRKSDSGLYQLQIKSKGETSYRKCLVTLCGQVTTVHVKEGEDVTLEFDNFTLQRVSRVQWFRDEWCIASLTTENKQISTSDGPGGRFKDRLQLDTQTGFLTIKNIRPEHTGVYYVRSNHSAYGTKTFSIMSDDSTETWSNESETAGLMGQILRCPGLVRKMCVFREQTDEKETDEKEKDEMKTVSIKEGDSLKLNTDTQIQMDDEILLMFGTSFATKHPYDIITRINKQINKQDKDEFKSAEKIFKDLKLDHSGSLTITINDTKAVHCGDYYVQITNKKNKSFKTFTFSVVPDGVFGETVNLATERGSVTLQAGVSEIQRYDQILWSYGPHGTIIANIKEEHPKCDFDMRFRDRLKLDETGSLTIKEAKTTDSGLYQLHVISSKKIRNKRFDVLVKDSSRNTEDDTIVSFDDLMSTNQNESDTLLNKRADGADDQEATNSP